MFPTNQNMGSLDKWQTSKSEERNVQEKYQKNTRVITKELRNHLEEILSGCR